MLVLTRKPGQSVQVGDYLLTVTAVSDDRGCTLRIDGPGVGEAYALPPGATLGFGGGSVTAVQRDSGPRIGLSFRFPRDVTILRTELLPC